MDPKIRSNFMKLVRDEDLADPSWILQLDAFDDPPLYTRFRQIEFLRPLPETQRVVSTLEIMLSLLEQHADLAARCAAHRRFFLCVTFSDFDSWRAGEQIIPTPRVSVNPEEEMPQFSDCPLVEAYSVDGKAVAQWLNQLGPPRSEQYCVGELSIGTFEPDLACVYVGWRSDPSSNVRSVGSEITEIHP